MEEEKEKQQWVDGVFQSMKGSSKATPNPALFSLIEQQIEFSQAETIPKKQWRFAVAAAILVLIMNVSALILYEQDDISSNGISKSDTMYSSSLISNYQIYEQ